MTCGQLAQYKRSVWNTRYPEGCIAEQYIIQECVMYCRLYINDSVGDLGQTSAAPIYSLNVWSPLVKVGGHSPRNSLTYREVQKAHWCVVENCAQAKYFVEKHQEMYELGHPNGSKMARVRHFEDYFKGWMNLLESEGSNFYSAELHSLSRMPQTYVCYSQCEVNGVKFVISAKDERKRTQNSGIMVDDGSFAYYETVDNIIELHYDNGMPVVVFDCHWYNTDPADRGSTKKDYGLLSVDTSTKWYEDWPYCLATTARHVFYLEDLKAGETWKVVNVVSQRGMYSESSLAREDETIYNDDDIDHPYQELFPGEIEGPNQNEDGV